MPSARQMPRETPPGNPPSGRTDGVALCCACPASGPVSTKGEEKYYSADYDPGWSIANKCKIALTRTATGGTVDITKSFSIAYSRGATEKDDKSTVAGAISSAISGWTQAARPWRVEIKQPGCETQKLGINFRGPVVASGGDVVVTADKRNEPGLRSYVAGGTAMTFYLHGIGDLNWTMIHEIGHTFGLPDEYTYDRASAKPAPVCSYKGADNPQKDVTLSTSAIPAPAGKFGFDNATAMGQNGNTTYPDYLFFWIAIEVKRILGEAATTAEVRIVAA